MTFDSMNRANHKELMLPKLSFSQIDKLRPFLPECESILVISESYGTSKKLKYKFTLSIYPTQYMKKNELENSDVLNKSKSKNSSPNSTSEGIKF